MEILLKFKLNDKEYCYYKENDTYKYGYLDGENISNELTQDEISLIKYVLYKITPSKDIFYYHDILYNGNNYQIYIDKKTGFKIFKPEPSREDLIYLNMKYNNLSPDVVYADADNTENNKQPATNKYIKYVIEAESALLAIYIAPWLITSAIIGPYSFSEYEGVYNSVISTIYHETIGEVKKAYYENLTDEEIIAFVTEKLEANKNITEEEKSLFLSNPKIFTENKEYINFEFFGDNLKNMTISYQDGTIIEGTSKKGASGMWIPSFKKIKMGYNEVDEPEWKRGVLTHEFCHTFSVYKNYTPAILEPLNDEFNSNYFTEDNGYWYCKKNLKALANIVGKEPLRKYQFCNDNGYVIEELMKIIDDKEMALKLINYMQDSKEAHEDNQLDKKEEYQKEIKNIFSKYYQAKYHKNMDDDLLMTYYFSENDTEYLNKIRYALDINGISYYDNGFVISEALTLKDINIFNDNKPAIYVRISDNEEVFLCNLEDLENYTSEDYLANSNKYNKGNQVEANLSYSDAIRMLLPSDSLVLSTDSEYQESLIIPELLKIINDKNMANNFTKHLIDKNYDNEYKSIFSKYYQAKYQQGIESNLALLAIFNENNFNSLIKREYNLDSDTKIIISKYENEDNILDYEIYALTVDSAKATKIGKLSELNLNINPSYFYFNYKNLKAIEKLIGSDFLSNFNYDDGIKTIASELERIIPDKEKSKELLNSLDSWKQNDSDAKYKIKNIFYRTISEYYMEKYHKDISTDLMMQYCLSTIDKNQVRYACNIAPVITFDGVPYGKNIVFDEKKVGNDWTVTVSTQEYLYKFSGYDDDGSVLFDRVDSEKTYFCDLDNIKNFNRQEYLNYRNSITINNDYNTIVGSGNLYNNAQIAMFKLLPYGVVDSFVTHDADASNEDIIKELMKIIPDRAKAEEFMNVYNIACIEPTSDYLPLYEEYYQAKYHKDPQDDLFLLSVYDEEAFDKVVRDKYELYDVSQVAVSMTKGQDGYGDYEVYILDNSDYGTYKDRSGNEIQALGINNVKDIGKLSDNFKDFSYQEYLANSIQNKR